MPRGKAAKSLALIDAAYRILARIQPCSVRAVCYQLFVAGAIPSMAKNETNRVGSQLVYAREQGLIPWSWIVDESREMEGVSTWNDPTEFADAVKKQYRRDYWAHQPQRVLVVSEKGTVRGTLRPLLDDYGVKFLPVHGFSSATTVYDLAVETARHPTPLLVLYVGDWDPSGLYMSRVDLPRRLEEYGANVEFRRIALVVDDLEYGDLPSFSVEDKRGDPRYRWFVEWNGHECRELDALRPDILRGRVEEAIKAVIDADAWERCLKAEAVEQQSLLQVMNTWNQVAS